MPDRLVRWLPVALVCGVITMIARRAVAPIRDPDDWWHLRLGNDLITQHSLATPENWSSFGSVSWVPTEPLPEVAAAYVERWLGLPGLAVLFWLAGLAVAVAVHAANRREARPLAASAATVFTVLAAAASLTSRPQLISFGAGMKVRYDYRGLPLEITRLGLDGTPFLLPDYGYAIVRLRWNERGRLLERGFFDATGKPLAQKTGQAGAQFEYDDLGNPVEQRFVDERGALVKIEQGYAIRRTRFDRLGRDIENTFYDERRQPALNRDGYYGFRSEYDRRGFETQRRYLGADGGPFRSRKNGNFGARYVLNRGGEREQEIFLDPSGNPVVGATLGRIEHVFDGYAREIERRYWTGDGKPSAAPLEGCAVFRTQHDSTGRVIAERCLDGSGQPMNRKDTGWAQKTISYESGRKIAERLLDARGREVKPRP